MLGRTSRIKDYTSSATLFDRQYTFNSASQIETITELTNSRLFNYDKVNRLKTMTASNNQNENYTYDHVGNRVSSHRSSTYGYQSDQFNQLTSTQTSTYNFDANGNTAGKSEGSNNWRYAWDYENRMSQAATRKQAVRYKFDALGRRVQRFIVGGKENTKFINDGNDVLVDDNSGTLTKYLNGDGIDEKLRQTTGTTKRYFLADHLGSTNGLTDSSGALTSQTAYDSFGNATNASFPSRYQFTGREYDSFSGFHYYRARMYDSNLGRFASEDPIGFGGGDVNMYGYVHNNSTNRNDSLGLIDPIVYQDPRMYPDRGELPAGNDFADWADEKTEYARRYWQGSDQNWVRNGSVNTGADLAFGFNNMFRVGTGLGQAMYCENLSDTDRLDLISADVVRGGSLFLMIAGPIGGRFAGATAEKPFLPDEYYYAKEHKFAPPEGAPYGRYDRFSPNGDLHQVTTYDGFGSRIHQYDIGPTARHGEGSHTFTYSGQNPRQRSGGGIRHPQEPF